MKKNIYINTSFEGIHKWKDAPDEVNFLRNEHRHIFNVKVFFEINHNDRDLEFFIMKKKVDKIINYLFEKDNKTGLLKVQSCEDVAQNLLESLDDVVVTKIEVNEDGENGITFER